MKRLRIDGPINIIQLQGRIHNIDKTLYLFMDIHYSHNIQSSCDMKDSIRIDEFLKQYFNNVSDMDFFL